MLAVTRAASHNSLSNLKGKNSAMTDGEQAKLRKKLYNKKWNAENRDKVNAAARKLYVKNAEKDREDSRKYYAANKERRDEYSKRSRLALPAVQRPIRMVPEQQSSYHRVRIRSASLRCRTRLFCTSRRNSFLIECATRLAQLIPSCGFLQTERFAEGRYVRPFAFAHR